MQVEVKSDVVMAFRELKKLIQRDRYEIEIKRKELHPKRSDRRRAKQAAARKRLAESERKRRKYEEYHARRKRLNPVDLRQQEMAGGGT